MNKCKQQKGITLIALVNTTIVMLILVVSQTSAGGPENNGSVCLQGAEGYLCF